MYKDIWDIGIRVGNRKNSTIGLEVRASTMLCIYVSALSVWPLERIELTDLLANNSNRYIHLASVDTAYNISVE